jgi:hypothetical protein
MNTQLMCLPVIPDGCPIPDGFSRKVLVDPYYKPDTVIVSVMCGSLLYRAVVSGSYKTFRVVPFGVYLLYYRAPECNF